MDIVYLVKECLDCEELTYSLRSLVNLPHDRVFIVGGCPRNIDKTKVKYVPVLQRSGNKFQNTTNSLKYICKQRELSESFVLMNDDFFILKPINLDTDLTCNRGSVEEVLKQYKQIYRASEYIKGMEQTLIYLKDLGVTNPLSYELHTPMKMNKSNLCEIFGLPYFNGLKIPHNRTIYGNLFIKESKEILDVKVYSDRESSFELDKFLSCDDISWNVVKNKIKTLFPQKSIYEI